MDFSLSPDLQKVRARYRAFARNEVLPLDTTPESYDEHDNIREDLLEAMKKKGALAPEGYDEQIKRYYEELIK